MHARTTFHRKAAAAGLVVLAGAGGAGLAIGSDHQDTPFVELNPKTDLTDVYAFPGATPGRIALAMDTRAFLTPAQAQDPAQASFDHNLLYQFKIDNNGDAREDKVIQVTFTGEGGAQRIEVRGPIAPPVQGAMGNEVADAAPAIAGALNTSLGDPNGMQAFAGPRDDPFFLDLEAFFCILPDRKPAGGALSGSCALQPSTTAPFFFRNPGVNYLSGFNVNSIVIELPSSMIDAGAPGKLGVWGSISQ
jgi:uncharacterized protein DUF4331